LESRSEKIKMVMNIKQITIGGKPVECGRRKRDSLWSKNVIEEQWMSTQKDHKKLKKVKEKSGWGRGIRKNKVLLLSERKLSHKINRRM
jgi:hypothetical protein